ncbi:DUF1793-domain-containing protein [Xylaria intraflava]|nr:DUF1793-domain-containing protein [Xylaria intraflava]
MRTARFGWISCAVAMAISPSQGAAAQGPLYSPLRPPALPLAVRNPYTNVWSTTSAGVGTLNGQSPRFWTSNSVGWEGIVVVDDIPYEYLGNSSHELRDSHNYTSAVPLTVTFDSQSSNFTFQAGPVAIEASFLSPVIPKDVCRSSIPLSYLTTTARSTDGQPHHIRFYSDVTSAWLVGDTKDETSGQLTKNGAVYNATSATNVAPNDIFTWIQHRHNEFVFVENEELPQWGNFTYSTSPSGASSFAFEYGPASSVRSGFSPDHSATNATAFASSADQPLVCAFVHDFGVVNETSVRYTLGSTQDPIVQYVTEDGLKELRPWWSKCYGDLHTMIRFHWGDYGTVQMMGAEFEAQLQADINKFYEGKETPVSSSPTSAPPPMPTNGTDQYGQAFVFDSTTDDGFLDPTNWTGIAIPFVSEAQSYYSIVALSARQIMGGYVFAEDPNANSSDPLVFQKEISSNGNVNTVDVLYPAAPFFLYANPNLLRYALQPLADYQEGALYTKDYCIHDLGTHFPNATGHAEGGEESMPVEESADFILMSYAYYKFTGDAEWLTSRYGLLGRFAHYLINSTLVPAAQLSTDDFAGALLNQSNLAIKGIVGLQAMSYVATVANQTADASDFADKAKSYYSQWESLAIDPSHRHTMLAYQWRSSWGLLYNIYFDKLLNMGLVDEKLYTMQSNWYPAVSQLYGTPLDSRHAYAKTDWQIWTAATCQGATRRLFINAIAYWLNETTTDGPFGDLYECTGTGGYVDNTAFRARPVVGGHYALLALGVTGQGASAEGGDTSGSLFPKNSPQPLRAPVGSIPLGPFGVLADEQKTGRLRRSEIMGAKTKEFDRRISKKRPALRDN